MICGRGGEIIVEQLVIEDVAVVTVVVVSATKGLVEVVDDEEIGEDESVFFPFSFEPVSFFFEL